MTERVKQLVDEWIALRSNEIRDVAHFVRAAPSMEGNDRGAQPMTQTSTMVLFG